jgi:2-oxoisovalerate dehydrogenase E1 component
MGCERSCRKLPLLKENAILTDAFDTKLRSDIKKEIDESLAIANAEPEIEAILSEELNDIFKPFNPEVISPSGI